MSESTRVGGVVLAGGESERFGSGNKLLATVDGTPVVRHAARTARDAALDGVVVVLGHDADAVRAALAGLAVETRENPDHAAGQSTAVRRGVEHARAVGWDGALFLLGDMPFVRTATVDRLAECLRAGDASVVAPRYEGTRGNPVGFGREHYDALAGLSGDTGGRELVGTAGRTRYVDVADPGVLRDVDEEADLP